MKKSKKIIILVIGLLIVVLGVILESTNTTNYVGRMDVFLRRQVSRIEMQPTRFIPTRRIAETFESTLKIKRVTEANQFVLSSPFGGKSIGEYSFCAENSNIDIQQLAFYTTGRGDPISVNVILSKPDNTTEVLTTTDITSWLRLDVTTSRQNVFSVASGTCSSINITIASNNTAERLNNAFWYKIDLKSIVSNARNTKVFNSQTHSFDLYSATSDGTDLNGSIAIFREENKIFLDKLPRNDDAKSKTYTGYLGEFQFWSRENNTSSVINGLTLHIDGETEAAGQSFPVSIYINSRNSNVYRDTAPRDVRIGDNINIPIPNTQLKYGDVLFLYYNIENATNVKSLKFSIINRNDINTNTPPPTIHDMQNGYYQNSDIPEIVFPYEGPLITFASQAPTITVSMNGDYLSQNTSCYHPYGNSLPNGQINSADKPIILMLNGNGAGLSASDLEGLTATQTFKATGHFQAAELGLRHFTSNDVANQNITVSQNQTFSSQPISFDGNFFNTELRLNSLTPVASSPSTPNIKIQLTNITLNKDIPVNVRIVYWSCDEDGYVETQMPSGTTQINIEDPALWKNYHESPALPANYNSNTIDEIRLYNACFTSYPGASKLHEFRFRHDSGKTESPFNNLNLKLGPVTVALTNWDSSEAVFSTSEPVFLANNGGLCLNMVARDPKPTVAPFTLRLDLTHIKAYPANVSELNTESGIPVYVDSDQHELSSTNKLNGIPIRINPVEEGAPPPPPSPLPASSRPPIPPRY